MTARARQRVLSLYPSCPPTRLTGQGTRSRGRNCVPLRLTTLAIRPARFIPIPLSRVPDVLASRGRSGSERDMMRRL